MANDTALKSKYTAYPEYKESGVEWLGDIPKEWTASKIKYLAPFQVGWTPPTKVDANFIGDNLWANISDLNGKYINKTAKNISDDAAKAASMDISPKGSLLYSFKLSVGAVSFANQDMYTNEAIASFLDGGLLPLSYMYYVLPKFVIQNASTNIYGARILNQELINSAYILAPPYCEAEKIANFLDHETAKIDTLIDKQQQLIKLLKEKRQAVVSHAVTKGLNPDVPMRDSGVEWLGEVPEHWVACSLRHYAYFIDGDRGSEYPNDKDFKENGVVFLSSKNIKEEKLDLTEVKFISQEKFNLLNRGKAIDGDLIVKVRGSVGRIGELAKFETVSHGYDTAFINAQMMIIRTRKGLVTNYLRLVSQSLYWTEQLAVGAYGAAQQQLSNDVFSNLSIVLPPESEQLKINEKIEFKLLTFNNLISKSQEIIELMQERRTALISAAVTGKIDVRNWVAPETSSRQGDMND
ncbi:MAG: restriction endonuclease subunit S [Marinomonas sp.]